MDARIEQELAILRRHHPDVEYKDRWFRIPAYPLPRGWSAESVDVAFYLRDGYPAISPYGIYVPSGLLSEGKEPSNFRNVAPTQPPFGGTWGVFSWQAVEWFPTADVVSGHNLLTWVRGFSNRFKEGA